MTYNSPLWAIGEFESMSKQSWRAGLRSKHEIVTMKLVTHQSRSHGSSQGHDRCC